MELLVECVNTQKVEVMVNPVDVLEKLYKKAEDTMTFSHSCTNKYNSVYWYIEDAEDVSVFEVYVKDGLYYGHYDEPDKEVGKVDRTSDFNPSFLRYLASLKSAIYYIKNKEED